MEEETEKKKREENSNDISRRGMSKDNKFKFVDG